VVKGNLNSRLVKQAVREGLVEQCKGKTINGWIRPFYRFDQVKKFCADLLKKQKGDVST
jgi:hypothetical protein